MNPMSRPMMKVYVSGFSEPEARGVAVRLRAAGMKIVSTWHDVREPDLAVAAELNFAQIVDADALVLVTSQSDHPGEAFVEVGIALGVGTGVFVVGQHANTMLCYYTVEVAADLDALLGLLDAFAEEVDLDGVADSEG